MERLEEIKKELSRNTSFDAEHEQDLFNAILEMEEAEEKNDLVPSLKKSDYILTILCILILGLGPVVCYAIQ